eukprot:scaffold4513_cov37-Cyclotella_meneghiniana.AAC.14
MARRTLASRARGRIKVSTAKISTVTITRLLTRCISCRRSHSLIERGPGWRGANSGAANRFERRVIDEGSAGGAKGIEVEGVR